jgi:hypothetical protein
MSPGRTICARRNAKRGDPLVLSEKKTGHEGLCLGETERSFAAFFVLVMTKILEGRIIERVR